MMASGTPRDVARASSPFNRLMSRSLTLVLRRLGLRAAGSAVTEEEIQALLREGLRSGVFEEAEQEIVKRVFRLGDHRASELMTPMKQIVWLDVADSPEDMKRKIAQSPHSRFPVCEGGIDTILGIIQVKDLLLQSFSGQPFGIRGLLMLPLFIYEGTPGLRVLELFKKTGIHIAVVLDEYGSVRGLLTLNDILEAIVGDLTADEDTDRPRTEQRPDGSWLLDGRLTLDEFRDILGIGNLPPGDYQTLGGLVIARLGRIPAVADHFDFGGFRFEVLGMDGFRVDQVLIAPFAGSPP